MAGAAVDTADMQEYRSVAVVTDSAAGEVAQRTAELLRTRLDAIGVDVATEPATDPDALTIYLGVPERCADLAALCEANRVPIPNTLDPGPEGYRIVSLHDHGRPALLAVSMDDRGMLYAVGEILRRVVRRDNAIAFPASLDVRGVARFPMRGLIVHQGHTITELTNSRDWTMAELKHAYLEFALAGANTFELGMVGPDNEIFQFLKSYGLDTLTVPVANVGTGPEEWQAVEGIGRTGYLCPSIPEAREALLEQYDRRFSRMAPIDFVHWKSGDGGGCECDECLPYGEKFIHLCEDLTEILHRYHPDTVAFVGNQKLDNAGDIAIFEYLQAEPRDWVHGIVYGPGSNAMGWMPGRRQDHRTDLFEYAAFGQIDRYLREILHQLPPGQNILFFTDLTHWVYSQYGLMDHEIIADRNYATPPPWDYDLYTKRPDPAMLMVYNRRTFFARPRHYHEIFQQVMRYGIGDVAYSEGHHDHLNQWMWQRLMWNPHRPVEDVVLEYARHHFGPEAAPIMAEAIFQHEENLMTPIADNPGIDRFNRLVEEAGEKMPDVYMRDNYLWRQYAQKGLIDKYIQLRVRGQQRLYSDVLRHLERGLESGNLEQALDAADARLDDEIETGEMRALKAEAGRLGQESSAIYGVRNEGLFNLQRDFVGLGWLVREVRRARDDLGDARRERVHRIVHYEEPGEGGFYDDAGNPGKSPNLVYGWPYGDGIFADANRPSQRRMAFTTDEEQGVTFQYLGLDPNAEYRVRLTLVRPRYLPRFGIRQHQTSQSIYADDHLLAENLELPEFESDFFEYDIPQEVTADGRLRLWFKKQPGVGEGPASEVTVWRNTGGWGTLVSEVWLMKK